MVWVKIDVHSKNMKYIVKPNRPSYIAYSHNITMYEYHWTLTILKLGIHFSYSSIRHSIEIILFTVVLNRDKF